MKKYLFISLLIIFSVTGCRFSGRRDSSPASSGNVQNSGTASVNQAGSQNKSLFGTIEAKYGITLKYQNIPESTWPSLTYKDLPADDSFLPKYLGYFNSEFNKYSVDFVKITNLKTIAFVKNLAVDGQVRAAAPDYYKEILFLDIYEGNYDEVYQRHVIHHEFYHMIEEQLNGDAYYKDPAWAAFNTEGFNYGKGGKFERGENAFPFTHPQTGFINIYSMSALEEDKAEIYAALFTDGEKEKLEKWIKEGDTVLENKVRYLTDFLKTNKQDL
jgi:hypothetical protein